jgi:hypothetical protein
VVQGAACSGPARVLPAADHPAHRLPGPPAPGGRATPLVILATLTGTYLLILGYSPNLAKR